uniref:Queuosine salvage protein n=1 Tax=Steinernema glaseri TaxID=37863 RepID=A0A1I7Y479_9BILA
MNFVPAAFIERVTSILSLEALRVLQEGQVGRWASGHPTQRPLSLDIAICDGKKSFCCYTTNSLYWFDDDCSPLDVFAIWNTVTCYFETVNLHAMPHGLHYSLPREAFTPMNATHFGVLKKMIAKQRRPIRLFDLQEGTEDLMDTAADILKVCGGVQQLMIAECITRIAPIVKKIISNGGVCDFKMYHNSLPICMIPVLTTQIEVGNLKDIHIDVKEEDVELCEGLIRMAVKHIIKQEHEYYSLLCPEGYGHILRPLQSELNPVPSKWTCKAGPYSYYLRPGKKSMALFMSIKNCFRTGGKPKPKEVSPKS